MKGFVQTKGIIKYSEKCRLNLPNTKDNGKIVEFICYSENKKYVFRNVEDHANIIVCKSDTDFVILPTKSQLTHLIDMCLDLGLEKMFIEYTDQFLREEYNN